MTENGWACLFVPEEWLLRAREERTLIHYLDGPVRDYFLWQSSVESGEAVPWLDRPHGVEGLLESYGDMLGLWSPASLKLCLKYLSQETIKGTLDVSMRQRPKEWGLSHRSPTRAEAEDSSAHCQTSPQATPESSCQLTSRPMLISRMQLKTCPIRMHSDITNDKQPHLICLF